jgi:F-type H+-transporting ATPase subunit a
MSAPQRGGLIFAVMIAMAVLFCWFVPFKLLPGMDAGVVLPVVQLPGEVLIEDFPVLGTLTNTAIGMLLTDLVVIALALSLRNPKMIPGKLQGFIELIAEYIYGLARQNAGPANAQRIFLVTASIFLVVLIGNWIELIPGVDSVGLMHCAHEGVTGYPLQGEPEAPLSGLHFLKVTKAMSDEGVVATHEDYEACHHKWFGENEAEAAEGEHETEGATETEEGAVEGEGLTPAQEEAHVVNDSLFVVTPFVRAAATDLNMTLGLAIIAFFFIQYSGVSALGIGYFAKFINLPALGNLSKKPMGVMDFAVGLLEIVSELSKIMSFGFRLFGNIFAGQVLLFVMGFLVATLLPSLFFGLELFVGLIQAFVFCMLTLVFASMAMISHHSDDDHHDAH